MHACGMHRAVLLAQLGTIPSFNGQASQACMLLERFPFSSVAGWTQQRTGESCESSCTRLAPSESKLIPLNSARTSCQRSDIPLLPTQAWTVVLQQ